MLKWLVFILSKVSSCHPSCLCTAFPFIHSVPRNSTHLNVNLHLNIGSSGVKKTLLYDAISL
jgi:hypothetical protein